MWRAAETYGNVDSTRKAEETHMSNQPDNQQKPDDEARGPEDLNDEGAGAGMTDEPNTFEPEEDPDAV